MFGRVVVVALLLMAVVAWVPQADANPLTIVTTSMDTPSQYVDVSTPGNNSLEFSGVCEAVVYGVSSVSVNLSATITVGSVSVSPQLFSIFPSDPVQPLSLSVNIPLLTNASEQIKVRLNGTWTQGPDSGEVGASEVMVLVNKVYLFSTSTSTPGRKTVKPGENVGFKINIFNFGNIWVQPELQILNESALNDNAITITYPDDIYIDVDISKEWVITANVGDSAPDGKYTIKLRIFCDNHSYSKDLYLFLTVEKYPNPVTNPKIMIPLGGVVLLGIVATGIYMKRRKS